MGTKFGDRVPFSASNLIASSYAVTYKTGRRLGSSPRLRLKRRLDAAIGEAPDTAKGVLLSLIADCDLRAYDTRRASKRWASAYYFLGLPAAVLATIAGATGLASTAGRIPAAIVALVSAGLSAAATFLNSNVNKEQSSRLSAGWQELADDVRLVVLRYSRNATRSPQEAPYDEEMLIQDVIRFNRRKAALLRGETSSAQTSSASRASK